MAEKTEKYLVRAGFSPQISRGRTVQNFAAGDIIDLTASEYEEIKHMIEPVKEIKEVK
jgi:hypothetical protein